MHKKQTILIIENDCFLSEEFYRQRAQVWLIFATPLTQRKQKECPHGNLTGFIIGCKQTLHSKERSELVVVINILPWLEHTPD